MAGRARPLRALADVFRRWQRDGSWQRILTTLQAQADAKGLITWEVSVDSTIARAHQHAAGARKRGTGNAKNQAESTSSRPTTPLGAPGAG
jgi:transposase